MKSMIPDSVHLLAVGLNHRTAPLALRETLAFTPEQTIAALGSLREKFPHAEAVILSTCNRVELYLASTETPPLLGDISQFLSEFHGLQTPDLHSHLYFHENRDAVAHLFTVTSSLDSMVVGETQILSQVKQAYQFAVDQQAVGGGGKVFHALFQRAAGCGQGRFMRKRISRRGGFRSRRWQLTWCARCSIGLTTKQCFASGRGRWRR